MTKRQELMAEAITEVLAETAEHPADRGAVVSWVVVAEVVGDDGDIWLQTIVDPDSKSWKLNGMLLSVSDDMRRSVAEISPDEE